MENTKIIEEEMRKISDLIGEIGKKHKSDMLAPKIEIFCICGSSGISRGDDTVFDVVRDIAREICPTATVRKFYSAWWMFRKKKFYKAIETCQAKNILLVGKSLGAVKLYKSLNAKPSMFYNFNNLRIATIDPHSPLPRLIDTDHQLDGTPWSHVARNVYQQDVWPDGATVTGALNKRVFNSNHYQIIHSIEVRQMITAALMELEK